MKVLDILKEATLKPRDFYQQARLDALIYMLEKGQPFTMLNGEKQVIKAKPAELKYLKSLRNYYDAGGNSQDVKDYIPRDIGGVKLTSIFKTEEFGGKGGSIGGKAEGVVNSGIGEVVEALKAAAIYTKLTTRKKPDISADEVIANLQALGANSHEVTDGKKISMAGTIAKNVSDVGNKVKDNIKLEINLARAPFQRVTNIHPDDADARGRLSSVINYVNSETDLAKYNRFFSNNQRRDPIEVDVKGLAGQKTDVETSYVDATGTKRPLSHLSMSIKAGSSKYDQASGLNEAGNIKFFNILGLSIDDARDAMHAAKFKNDLPFERRVKSVVKLYTLAAELLDNKLAALNDKGEADYIHVILNNLKKSIQGDQRLVYVNFDANGTYYKLNPQLIHNLAHYVNLDAKIVMKKWPYLYVQDSNTGKNLFHVRLQVNSTGRLTHIFELDNLLELVKDATVHRNASDQAVQQPAPVVPQTVPVKKQPKKQAQPVQQPVVQPPEADIEADSDEQL